MFIAAYSQQTKTGNNPNPSAGEWINKMCDIHTMEYYSVMKKNELLIHATQYNMDEPQKHYAG